MRNLLILIFCFPTIAFSQNQWEKEKIKLTLKKDNKLVHFKSLDYILSFQLQDISSISKDLELSYDFSENDTIDLKLFIIKMDSLGRGNWVNNFRLNNRFRQLIDSGNIKLYSIRTSEEVFKLECEISGHINAGTICTYKYDNITVLEFAEAFVGCPAF